MKTRVTVTIDPAVLRRAKKLAHAHKTSVSALIEGFLRTAPLAGEKNVRPFARRWSGKFRVAAPDISDARLTALRERYSLEDK
jgi:hypothetical protein